MGDDLMKCAKFLSVVLMALSFRVDAQVYNYFAPGGALFGSATVQSINLAASGYLTGQLPISFVASGNWPGNAATATALATTPTQCSGQFAIGVQANGNANCAAAGSVTSVTVMVPAPLTATGCVITSSGTCAITWTAGEAANEFLATPNGSAGQVILRAIVAADLPSSITSNTTGTAAALASSPTGCTLPNVTTGIAANGNSTCSEPSDITGNAPTATALAATPSQCSGTLASGITASGNANCTSSLGGNSIATIQTGSFTGTLTGCTTTTTGTITYSITGDVVSMHIGLNCTSNSTTHNITGLPASTTPVTSRIALGETVSSTSSPVRNISEYLIQSSSTTIEMCNGLTSASCPLFAGSGTEGTEGADLMWSIH